MNARVGFLVFAALVATPALSQEHDWASSLDPALVQVNERFNDAIESENIEELLALYAENAVFLAPNESPVRDSRVIKENYVWVFEQGAELSHTLDQGFVAEDGTLAVMIGRYRLHGGSPDLDDSGSYLFALTPAGNSWEIVADIFNSDIRSTSTKSSGPESSVPVPGDGEIDGEPGRDQGAAR
ncbi:nuclear transport factor 2 family protein [uncultured Roseobacter sp.]|uniref:YybH family protein n=1 Tax=uncultured Roseobacter sp. TaxID=114847 RepID=UPI00262FBAC5|nr:nuclear transport factor 2 family protein [uncultured Roseobacter sp.]